MKPSLKSCRVKLTSSQAAPLVSVVIPYYNRPTLLTRCLNSLREQRFSDFEIIVVDDGSTEPFLADSNQFNHWPRLNWQTLPLNQGRAAARNAGIQVAQGQLLIFLDCDMAVNEDFIGEHWRHHGLNDSFTIGQGQIIGTPEPSLRPKPSIWTDASRAHFATGNVSIRRSALLTEGGVGNFDEEFSAYGFEDLELGYRLEQAGWHARPVKNAISWHYEPAFNQLNWEADIKKELARGQGAALFYHKHPSFEVRLIAQLTPLHAFFDQALRIGGLITETKWQKILQKLEHQAPKLSLALYRALLNRYCREATLKALTKLEYSQNADAKT